MPFLSRLVRPTRGLTFKFIIGIFTSVALVFILIVLYNYTLSKRAVEKNLRMNAENLTKKAVAQIETVLTAFQKVPDNYSQIIEGTDFSKEALLRILKQELISNPEIFGAALAFEPDVFGPGRPYDMSYYFRNLGMIEEKFLSDGRYDYFTMDWYQIPKMLDRPVWSDPYFDEGAGNVAMSTYSVPLYRTVDGRKRFVGILTADVSLAWLEKIVDAIRVYDTGYGFVISGNGTIVTHPMREMMMNETIFSIAEAQESEQLRRIGRNMIRGEESFAELEYRNVRTGKLSWIAYAPVALNGWSIGVVFPVDEFMADVNSLFSRILLLGGIGMVLILTIIILISSSITRPLRILTRASRRIAEGNFQVVLPEVRTKDEMKELHDSFAYMQRKLSEYVENLRETTAAREKIESELRIARDIQMGMIPHLFPPFPDLTELDLYAVLKPAKEVGGDLYDFFLLGEDKLCFAIGDVSGKGVPASLFMAVTRTLLRSVADREGSPADFVRSLNKSLSANNESCMFVTFFVGLLDLASGEVVYANAGHNPPVVIRKNGDVQDLEMDRAVPVGVLEDYPFQNFTTRLAEGDKLFLYTDGVTEAENGSGEFYSVERLLNRLAKNSPAGPETLIKTVGEDLSRHVGAYFQSDDITMMSIIFYGRDGNNPSGRGPKA